MNKIDPNNKYSEGRKLLCSYLHDVAREKNISHDVIAEKTGFNRANVTRMLSGRYSPTLDNFMKLCDAVGTYFFIIDKDDDSELATLMKNRWGKTSKN